MSPPQTSHTRRVTTLWRVSPTDESTDSATARWCSTPTGSERRRSTRRMRCMNGWTARLPGVPAWGISVASSTPRSLERRTSDGPLLAPAPGGVPPTNRANPSLRKGYTEPLSPRDEVSTLASEARAGLTGRARFWSPLKTYFAGREQGLTARPSPLTPTPPTLKGLSTREARNRGTPPR